VAFMSANLADVLKLAVRILIRFLTQKKSSHLHPKILSLVEKIKRRASSGNVKDLEMELIGIIRRGGISVQDLFEFLKIVIMNENIRGDIKLRMEDISLIPTALRQFRFYYSGVDPSILGEFDKIKYEILSELGQIEELVSYYFVPSSFDEVKDFWRLPSYIDKVLMKTQRIKKVIKKACSLLLTSQHNVVILGQPGVGKTVILYMLIKHLFLKLGMNVGILLHGKSCGRIHEKEGFILFLDDGPKHLDLLESIYYNNAHGIITTARTIDWEMVSSDIKSCFYPIVLESPSDEELNEFLTTYAKYFSISIDEPARKIIIRKCGGSPIYIRYLLEDAQNKGVKRITIDYARESVPDIYDYLASILETILYEDTRLKPGAQSILFTLRILGDFKYCEIHEAVLDTIYEIVRQEVFNEPPNYDLYLRVRSLLARDPEKRSLSFPHDIWYDIIVESMCRGRIGNLLSFLNNRFDKEFRYNIIRKAFLKVREKILSTQNVLDKMSIEYYAKLNEEILGHEIVDIESLRKTAEKFKDTRIARMILIATKTPEVIKPSKPITLLIKIKDKALLINSNEVEIGRNPDGFNLQIRYNGKVIDLPVYDPTISRKHLKIIAKNQKIYVIDLGSKNGTWIKDKRIPPNKPVEANKVLIGGFKLPLTIELTKAKTTPQPKQIHNLR